MKWTKEDSKLLNEMKDRCLNKGQYVDEKAKDKFKLLCHLEDFIIQYYELEKDYKRTIKVMDKGLENTYKKVKDLQEENNELKQIIDIRECQLEEMQMNKTDYTQVNILEMQLEDLQEENERLKKRLYELTTKFN